MPDKNVKFDGEIYTVNDKTSDLDMNITSVSKLTESPEPQIFLEKIPINPP